MPKKVIHVLGAMNAGGVESWLMCLLRNTDSSQIKHEFIVHDKKKAFYDDEINQLKSNTYYCNGSNNFFLYSLNLYKLLKSIKPDVIHSHVHTFSGIVVLVALLAGVKIRISHSHSDTRIKDKKSGYIRKAYLFLMRLLISLFSTKRLAVSQLAAECLYGEKWMKKNCSVVLCGVDINKYNPEFKNLNMRSDLGIPDNAYVLGHVGRFSEPKNHDFLIDVFYNLRKINKDAYLVLVGDGELREKIEDKIRDLKLSGFVILMGLRKDVPLIMISVFDILVFPSLWEGLPLTLVEAQFSRKFVIASSNITKICDIGLVTFKDLIVSDWVNEIEKKKCMINDNPEFIVSRADKFLVKSNIVYLNAIYEGHS